MQLIDAGSDVRQLRWSTDGKQLAWIARKTADEPSQVYSKTPAGGIAALTQAPEGVEAFEWSPDGTRIAYTAFDAKTADEARAIDEGRDWVVFGSVGPQLRLYVVNLATSRELLVTRAEMSVHYFNWSPRGDQFVIVAAPTASVDDQELRTRLYTVAAVGGEPTPLIEQVGKLAFPSWSADGRWIAWLGSTAVTDPWYGSVFVMPAVGGTAPRNVTSDYAGTATWLGALPGKPATFVFQAEEGQGTVLRSIDALGESLLPLMSPAAILSGPPSFARDGRTFATAANTPLHPDEIFVGVAGRAQKLRRLTHSNPQLDGMALGTQEVVRWKSRDGSNIEGVLIKPVGFQAGRRYPTVVHVHGGSESVISNGWRGSYRDWGQSLAARGYAVIYPNYRGSRGRGTAFLAGNRRDLMGREWEDIESALDHVIALGIGDPARAGIYGFSWGGYAAGWGATFASHRFKAAVGGAGIYNWISEAGSNDSRMHEQLAHWDAPLYEHFSLYLERSPIYEIRKANTPLLMLHGAEDQSCPIGQAIEMHTAMRWKGVPVELVIYPREGHGMSERAHQRDFLTRGLSWFDRYLQ